jgi:hypothetical protein
MSGKVVLLFILILTQIAKADCSNESAASRNLADAVSILPLAVTADGTRKNSLFNSDDLGKCIVSLIHQNMSGSAILTRLSEADIARMQGVKSFLAEGDHEGILNNKFLMAFIPFSKEDAYEVEAFHSAPLLNYKLYNGQPAANSHLDRLTDLYRSLSSNKSFDLTLEKGLLARLNTAVPSYAAPGPVSENATRGYAQMMAQADVLVDPLVKNLLETQERNSVTPWELVKRATAIYHGDVVSALGAIGHALDVERINVKHREKRLYLGSRISPLFSDTQNPLGDNYHFWMYLNAALQGKGGPARWMSLSYQTFVGDPGEKRADSLGISTGEYIRKALLTQSKTDSCPLDQNSNALGLSR